MLGHSKDWKQKITQAAREFVFPQRSFEKLVASITGVPMIKEYTMFHLPFMWNIDEQHAIAMLQFKDPKSADKICELLNEFLIDAANEKHSKRCFYGVVRHHGHPMMDRIVFLHYDNDLFPLSVLHSHLLEVKKHIDKTGRTLAEQVQQQAPFRKPRLKGPIYNSGLGKWVPQVS